MTAPVEPRDSATRGERFLRDVFGVLSNPDERRAVLALAVQYAGRITLPEPEREARVTAALWLDEGRHRRVVARLLREKFGMPARTARHTVATLLRGRGNPRPADCRSDPDDPSAHARPGAGSTASPSTDPRP